MLCMYLCEIPASSLSDLTNLFFIDSVNSLNKNKPMQFGSDTYEKFMSRDKALEFKNSFNGVDTRGRGL